MSEPTALSAETVEALAEVVNEWSRPKSSAEFGGDLVTDFLAPTVARLIHEATTEARADTEALRERVEAVLPECLAFSRTPGLTSPPTWSCLDITDERWDTAMRCLPCQVRAALSLPADTPEEGR